MLINHMATTYNSHQPVSPVAGMILKSKADRLPCSFALPTTSGSRSVKPMSMPEDQESLSVLVAVEGFHDFQWIEWETFCWRRKQPFHGNKLGIWLSGLISMIWIESQKISRKMQWFYPQKKGTLGLYVMNKAMVLVDKTIVSSHAPS